MSPRRLALWGDVGALFGGTPQAETARNQQRAVQGRQCQERLRRRDDARDDAAAAAAATPRSSEVAFKAEQRMAPGSKAAQEQAQAQSDRQARASRGGDDFRRTLADARRDTSGRRVAAVPSETGAGQPAGNAADGTAKGDESRGQQPAAAQRHTTAAHDAPLAETRGPTPDAGPARPIVEHSPRAAAVGATASAAASQRLTSVPTTAAATTTRTTATAPVSAVARTSADAAGPRAAQPVAATSAAGDRAAKPGERVAANRTESANAERSDDANFERVLRVIRMQLARDKSTATIRLDPPELGKLELRLELRGSQLALDVAAPSDAARQLLEDQVDTLRRGLEATGLTLERMEVRVVQPTPMGDSSSQPNNSSTPQFASDGGQSFSRGDEGGVARHVPTTAPAEPAMVEAAESQPAAESLVNLWA